MRLPTFQLLSIPFPSHQMAREHLYEKSRVSNRIEQLESTSHNEPFHTGRYVGHLSFSG
jgi:hypothetical protein